MTGSITNALDACLLENWQRGLPIVEHPFAAMANACGATERDVIARLERLRANRVIARVGAVFRPNTIGASTLAAVAVPDFEVDRVAELMSAEPGVNHVYLRENDWNVWFVATGPDLCSVSEALSRLSSRIGRRVLDLRLETPYYIDLGFSLEKPSRNQHRDAPQSVSPTFEVHDSDRDLAQQLTTGLPLISRPFGRIANDLHRTEAEVIGRIKELSSAGIISRLGVIVRHRALGWRSNAMVVWDVPGDQIDKAGAALAALPGINLCYRRTRYENAWPFNLYCMVHAKSRNEALAVISEASVAAGLQSYPREILFSTRCFKQTGALIAKTTEAA